MDRYAHKSAKEEIDLAGVIQFMEQEAQKELQRSKKAHYQELKKELEPDLDAREQRMREEWEKKMNEAYLLIEARDEEWEKKMNEAYLLIEARDLQITELERGLDAREQRMREEWKKKMNEAYLLWSHGTGGAKSR